MPNTITWEQRKLGEVVERITRKNLNLESRLPLTISAQDGLISQTEFFDKQVASKNISGYYLIENGEFAYNKSYSNGYPWGAIKRLDKYKNGVLSTLYIVFKPIDVDSQFLVSYFDTTFWHSEIAEIAVEGARNHGLLNIPVMDFFRIKIKIPKSKEEQTQIGNFFKQLDDTIALHQRELEKFKILKTSYLENIFLDKVSLFTAKNTITWEQRKLGDVVEIIGGGTPDTNNTAYWNGNIDWYSPTEIGNKPYVSGSLKKISVLGLQKSSAKILPANKTILFTSRAGIGDMAILTKQGTTNQGFQSFILKNDVDIYFLYSMGFKIKDFALKNASGSTFLEISKSQLSQMKLYLPSLKEQTQIGNFFKQLDDTIALHQKELAKYQQIKTACLEKMFVE